MSVGRTVFVARDQTDLISRALAGIDLPDRCSLRAVHFLDDLRAVAALPMGPEDRIHPCYGMAPAEDPGELTLVVELDGTVIGQVSAAVSVIAISGHVGIDLHYSGLFLSADMRGKGLGLALAEAVFAVTTTWGETLAREIGVEGTSVVVGADAEAGSAGAHIIDALADRCLTPESFGLST